MQRRKFVVGLGSLAAGGAAAMGTGAFRSVNARRSVSVEATGDASAFLSLTGDAQYITNDSSSGTLSVDIGSAGTSTGGDGLNKNANTVLRCVNIEHQGASDTGSVDLDLDTTSLTSWVSASLVNDYTLSPGQEVSDAIEFTIDLQSGDPSNDPGSLNIKANQP